MLLRERIITGNQLTIELAFDQTEPPALLRDLDELTRAFPVRGNPDG